jgi:hypothetical protein
VRDLLLRLLRPEIGNGRACVNARREEEERAHVHARIDALGRRLPPPGASVERGGSAAA